MDRLFLDANVLFSAAYKANARLLELWKLSDVLLWSSRYALEEVRVNFSGEDQIRRLKKLAEALTLHEAADRQDSCRNPPSGKRCSHSAGCTRGARELPADRGYSSLRPVPRQKSRRRCDLAARSIPEDSLSKKINYCIGIFTPVCFANCFASS